MQTVKCGGHTRVGLLRPFHANYKVRCPLWSGLAGTVWRLSAGGVPQGDSPAFPWGWGRRARRGCPLPQLPHRPGACPARQGPSRVGGRGASPCPCLAASLGDASSLCPEEEGGGRTSSECSTQAISQDAPHRPWTGSPSCLIEGKPGHSGPKTQGQERAGTRAPAVKQLRPGQPCSAQGWPLPSVQGAGLRPGSSPTPSTLRRPPSCTDGAVGTPLAAHQPSPLLPASGPAGPAAWGALSLFCPGLRQAAARPPHVVHADRPPVLRNLPWPHLSPVSVLARWTLHGLCCSLHF